MISSHGHIDTGLLNFVDFNKLEFTPKRMFFVTNVPAGSIRGGHGHYKDRQCLMCVKGSIEIELVSKDGVFKKTIKPGEYCYMNEMVWASQKYVTGDDILLVLCSEEFDKSDYFYNKEEVYKN